MKIQQPIPYPKHYQKQMARRKGKNGTTEYTYYRCKVKNPYTGKVKWFSAKRKVDCQRKVESQIDNWNQGLLQEEDPSFSVQKQRYLDLQKKVWSEREYKNQKSYLRHFDCLGSRNVDSITPEELKVVFAGLARGEDMRGNTPASRTTLLKIRTSLSMFWDYLLNQQMVRRNIVSSVVLPKDWGDAAEVRKPLTDDQIVWVQETPDVCQVLAMVMIYAGLRTSEACSLRRKDVILNPEDFDDPDSNYIVVDHSMNLTTGELKDKTKTPAGYRRIPLCRKLYDFLRENLIGLIPEQFICFPEFSAPITADRLRVLWRRYMMALDQKYGNPGRKYVRTEDPVIDTFTTYQCRHTFCTLCYEAGLDVQSTAYLMGHSDIRMTEQVYTHLREEQKWKNLRKLKDLE